MKNWLTLTVLCAGLAIPAWAGECTAPDGWEDVADAAEGQVLIFGELHGTNEMPVAFAEYVCAVAGRGGKTIVALEILDLHAGTLAKALTAEEPSVVMQTEMADFWRGTDGRESKAMFEMILRLGELSQSGLDIEIVPFVALTEEDIEAYNSTKDQGIIEKAYAAGLNAATVRSERVVVLVGSLHARKTRSDWMKFDPMAHFVDPEPLSLVMTHAGGEAWNMQRDGAGIRKAPYREEWTQHDDAPVMRLTDDFEPAHDGYIFLGSITASRPAIED